MKKLLVTTLLLSCMTLVGCNPITMKITASDDLSNINVEVDGFSMENITVQPDGSINLNLDGATQDNENVVSTQNNGNITSAQDVTMQNASMQTSAVPGTSAQDITSTNVQENATAQNTVATNNETANQTTEVADNNQTTTDNTTNVSAAESTQKDSYSLFKELVKTYLLDQEGCSFVEFNPEAVDFSFVSGVNNDWAYVTKAYVIKDDEAGKVFLVISYDAMSGDYVTDVYDVSGDTAIHCATRENVDVYSYRPYDGKFDAEVTLNVLGTYWVKMEYELKDNGDFVLVDNIYTMDTSYNVERYTLTITKELPVWMEGGNTVLQPGTKIIIDGVSTWNEMFFKVAETGEQGYITYEFDTEGRVTINGLSESEYFESLLYSG